MVIDLKKLKQSGKDKLEFVFEYLPKNELSSIPNVKLLPPVKVLGKVSISGKNSVVVKADITYVLSGDCTRCLKHAEKTYIAILDEEFVSSNEVVTDNYTYQNDKLDLTKAVDDTILMDMPLNFLCDENCEGIKL